MAKIAFQNIKPAARPVFTRSFDEFPVDGEVLTFSVRRPDLADQLTARGDVEFLQSLYPVADDGTRNRAYFGGQFFEVNDQHFNVAAYLASIQASSDPDERYSANEILAMLFTSPALFAEIINWSSEVIPTDQHPGN